MTNKELQEQLSTLSPDAVVITGVWNKYTETYGLIDYANQYKYEEVENDFFGTPGRMDKRLFDPDIRNFICLGSLFGRVKNDKIDFGDDDINHPIKLINGKDGDHELILKINGFRKVGSKWVWEKDEASIVYEFEDETVSICNPKANRHIQGSCVGIEDLREMIKVCKIDKVIMS